MFLRYFALLLALCFAGDLSAQAPTESPYHFSIGRELLFGGTGGVAGLAGIYFQNRIPDRTLRELKVNEFSQINGFDRSLGTFDGSNTARKWSDRFLNYSAASPLLLLAGRRPRREFHRVALLYTETMVIAGGITSLTKATLLRTRPYVFAPDFDRDRVLRSGDRASLISGHTSMSAAGAFFCARVFADYHPESKLRPWVWAGAALLPATTGYLRIRAARHFATDVMAGYLVGASVGYLVPTLHKKALLPKGLSASGGWNGVRLVYAFQ